MTYALINPQNQVFRYEDNVDPAGILKAGWKRLIVVDTKPTFDPNTQALDGPVVTIEAARVTRVWTLRAQTSAEMDANSDSIFDGITLLERKMWLNHENRIRVLEGKAEITMVQFRNGIRAVFKA